MKKYVWAKLVEKKIVDVQLLLLKQQGGGLQK